MILLEITASVPVTYLVIPTAISISALVVLVLPVVMLVLSPSIVKPLIETLDA